MQETWVRSLGWEDPLEWQPIPVFLPGESHGRKSRAGYSTWGCKESDTTGPLMHSFNTTHIPGLSPAHDNSSAARILTPPTSITTCSHKTAPESHYLRWDPLYRCQLLLAEAMSAIWNLLAPIPAGLLPQLYEESRYGAFKHCKNLTGLPWWLSGKESAC